MTEPNNFNENTKRILVNYIRDIADRMGLKDWQFTVEELKDDDSFIARTNIWGSDSHTATILIGDPFWKYGPRHQRETLVHELVHWHTDKLFQTAIDIIQNTNSMEVGRVSRNTLDRFHELAVDGIAMAWAREMPFIDWADQRPFYHEYEDNTDKDEKREVG